MPKYYCVPDIFSNPVAVPACDDCGAALTQGSNPVFGAVLCDRCYNARMWDFCAARSSR